MPRRVPARSERCCSIPELAPDDAEPLVERNYGDSFEDTALETLLAGLAVGRLVVVGSEPPPRRLRIDFRARGDRPHESVKSLVR